MSFATTRKPSGVESCGSLAASQLQRVQSFGTAEITVEAVRRAGSKTSFVKKYALCGASRGAVRNTGVKLIVFELV